MDSRTGRPRPADPESEIVRRLADRGPALVALSGGVDSGLVAALAAAALGPRAVAVTVVGSAIAADELAAARAVAAAAGVAHRTVAADPIERPEYRANGADRCYHCRSVETGALVAWGAAHGVEQYLDGIHVDDLADERPGLRAMDAAGFAHPLLEAGWGKTEVRIAARRHRLPNAERPSNACLASRVARGMPITAELLARIERAEAVLASRGFRRVRVRVGAAGARIEVDPDELPRLVAAPLADELLGELRALGFPEAEIDPRGYRGPRVLPVLR